MASADKFAIADGLAAIDNAQKSSNESSYGIEINKALREAILKKLTANAEKNETWRTDLQTAFGGRKPTGAEVLEHAFATNKSRGPRFEQFEVQTLLMLIRTGKLDLTCDGLQRVGTSLPKGWYQDCCDSMMSGAVTCGVITLVKKPDGSYACADGRSRLTALMMFAVGVLTAQRQDGAVRAWEQEFASIESLHPNQVKKVETVLNQKIEEKFQGIASLAHLTAKYNDSENKYKYRSVEEFLREENCDTPVYSLVSDISSILTNDTRLKSAAGRKGRLAKVGTVADSFASPYSYVVTNTISLVSMLHTGANLDVEDAFNFLKTRSITVRIFEAPWCTGSVMLLLRLQSFTEQKFSTGESVASFGECPLVRCARPMWLMVTEKLKSMRGSGVFRQFLNNRMGTLVACTKAVLLVVVSSMNVTWLPKTQGKSLFASDAVELNRSFIKCILKIPEAIEQTKVAMHTSNGAEMLNRFGEKFTVMVDTVNMTNELLLTRWGMTASDFKFHFEAPVLAAAIALCVTETTSEQFKRACRLLVLTSVHMTYAWVQRTGRSKIAIDAAKGDPALAADWNVALQLAKRFSVSQSRLEHPTVQEILDQILTVGAVDQQAPPSPPPAEQRPAPVIRIKRSRDTAAETSARGAKRQKQARRQTQEEKRKSQATGFVNPFC